MWTVPSRGATSWCSIFMASTESSTWPASTVSPLLTDDGHHGAGHRRAHRRVGGAFLAFDGGQHPGEPGLPGEHLEPAGPALVAEEDVP